MSSYNPHLPLPYQAVVERSHMSGEFFSLYLQQNYLEFFSDVEDVARASEYLSDADFLTAEWSVSSTRTGHYGLKIKHGRFHYIYTLLNT